jgi:hypothetical protein
VRLSRDARIDAVCVRCGDNKKPVIRVMKADGQTTESYVCISCRVELGRAQEKTICQRLRQEASQ